MEDLHLKIKTKAREEEEGSTGEEGGFSKPGPLSSKRRHDGSNRSLQRSSLSSLKGEAEPLVASDESVEAIIVTDDEALASDESTSSRKRGRPPTTGLYVKRAEAKRKLLDQQERELRLQQEKKLMEMTPEELYNRMGLDVEAAVETMKMNPTADLTIRVKELQKGVLHVAKSSRNLYGPFIKQLKEAALLTSACVEVLRTRVENVPGSESASQLDSLRRELADSKKRADEAQMEAKRLKEELAESRKREGMRRTMTRLRDSSDSSSGGNARKKTRMKSLSKSPRERRREERLALSG